MIQFLYLFDNVVCWYFKEWVILRLLVTSLSLLLITLCKHFKPDKARQNVRPDLDPMGILEEFFEKVNFQKKTANNEKASK